jgi:hypothetical protein
MLDNLRNQATFQDDEPLEPEAPKPSKPRRPRRSFDKMVGMTAPQRFALAIMLAIVVCLLGVMLLVLSGKVALPSFL